MTKIIQIAAVQDRDGDPRLFALYDNGKLFERVSNCIGSAWRLIPEPEEIVKEREERNKKMLEYATKGSVMFAGKVRDYPDGIPLPEMDCLLDVDENRTCDLTYKPRSRDHLDGMGIP